jgi:aminopeptidase N
LDAVKALQLSLQQEFFWPVRVEVCTALGSMTLDQAFAVLRQSLQDRSPHVRRAAIQALGNQKTPHNFQAIRPFLEQGDPSYQVEAAAATALGTIAGGSVDRTPEEAEVIGILQTALATRAGWNEVVRCGVVAGLAQLKESEAALEILLQHTKLGISQPLRLAAIRALGVYASDREQPKVLERLRELSRETFFFTQLSVVSALSQLNTSKAIPILQSIAAQEGRIARRVSEALEKVQTRSGADQSLKQLREELDQVKQTNRDLLSRLEALEAQQRSSGAPEAPAG